VKILQAPDPNGPFGAKEASEGALHGFPPALTNAVADALGIRMAELPVSPDRLLHAIHARRLADNRKRNSSKRNTRQA